MDVFISPGTQVADEGISAMLDPPSAVSYVVAATAHVCNSVWVGFVTSSNLPNTVILVS
jgi:hypothetical protein